MPYSTDSDLARIRPKIMAFALEPEGGGDPNWDDQRIEAESMMVRDLDIKWYRSQGRDRGIEVDDLEAVDYRPLDTTLFTDPEQFKRLSCYKTLVVIYLYLQKDSKEPDVFERERVLFTKFYAEELAAVIAQGIGYDWDSLMGSTTYDRGVRRLKRG